MSAHYPRAVASAVAVALSVNPPPILDLKSTGKRVYRMMRYVIPGSIQSPEIDAALEHSAKLLDDPFSDEPPEVVLSFIVGWLLGR